tara:strand:- start:2407 stop:3120 length:714 start_codon:yes stop_codon:yes gene_type:complete
MIGSFGRKHKSHGKNYGKKDTSKFKKGLIAGGMLLATGAGIWASKGDKETHQEVEYPLVAQDPEADGAQGHNPALVSKLEVVGQPIGQQSAPAPAINLVDFDKALNDPKPAKKAKIGAALKLAGEVVAGDAGGKVDVAKKGLDIARGEGEAESTKSVQEQIKAAEKASKGSSLSQIGSLLGLSRGNKTDKKFANVAVAPMIGPVAPPEFFEAGGEGFEPSKSKKDKVKGFFAKSKND